MSQAERDLHVLKYFSSVIAVSEGKVIHLTVPSLRYCPLAYHFYPELKETNPDNPESWRMAVRKVIERKIRNYGFFTKNRSFEFPDHAVPYGASEMLAALLKNQLIDAAVIVCDGAGTVVTDSPAIVQGIGARMNTLIFTSPIPEIIKKLKIKGSYVVFEDNAWIDPVRGVERAISLDYKRIGVTVAGFDAEKLEQIRILENRKDVSITILVVCTTGIPSHKIEMIRRNADLVWSCASGEVRKQIGIAAKIQLSKQIPVFVLTERGVVFASSCQDDLSPLQRLDPEKQYLVSGAPGTWLVCSGFSQKKIRQTALPVETGKSPAFVLNKNERAAT